MNKQASEQIIRHKMSVMIMKKISSVCIDPGHVGGDALDFREVVRAGLSLREGDFCFHWAKYLKQVLESQGLRCVLTREFGQRSLRAPSEAIDLRREQLLAEYGSLGEILSKKFCIPPTWRQGLREDQVLGEAVANELDLSYRATLANSSGCDLLLSLHLNGSEDARDSHQDGVCGFTNRSNPLFIDLVKALSNALELPFVEYSQFESLGEGLYKRDLLLLREVQIPVLILEGPFQTGPLFESLVEEASSGKGEIIRALSHAILDVLKK